jgi:signal peptidase
MEPTLLPGDVVVTRGTTPERVCSDVSIGTIVTYLPTPNDPALITHRVVGKTIGTFDDGSTCRLITQGDNNSAADEPVSPEQVRGVFMFGLPKLGWARQWVGGNGQAALIAGGIALVAYGVWSSTRKPKTRILNLDGTPLRQGGDAMFDAAGIPPVGAARHAAPQDPEQLALDRELRSRELDLREREIDLRAQELELAWRRAGVSSSAPGGDGTAHELTDMAASHSPSAPYSSEA